MSLYEYRRPSRARRWVNLLRDVPALLADRVGDDQDPRAIQVAMAGLLTMAVLTMAFYLGGFIISRNHW